ncbi:MAG: hypothetical protein ACK50J_07310 [Planctomyces sp.]
MVGSGDKGLTELIRELTDRQDLAELLPGMSHLRVGDPGTKTFVSEFIDFQRSLVTQNLQSFLMS